MVDALTPGWEDKISNKVLDDYFIRWNPYKTMSYKGEPWNAEYTRFGLGHGSNVRQGYVNIKNPLYVTKDLMAWEKPQAWFQYANSVEAESEITKFEALMGNTSYDVPLGEEGVALDMTAKSDVMVEISKLARKYHTLMSKEVPSKSLKDYEAEFSDKLRRLLKSNGYDSIQYVNGHEDKGSTSYILLDDNMYKSVDDFAFDGTSIFSTKRAINQTNESEIVESRRVGEATATETALSRIGNSRANSFLKGIQKAIEPLMAIEGYDKLEVQRMLTKGEIGKWENTGRIVFDILNQTNAAEKKQIYKYFTTRDASSKGLPNRKVSFAEERTIMRGTRPGDKAVTRKVSIRDKVIETKKRIASIGEDLVKTGMITTEQYAEWKNKYLPKMYIEHVMGGQDKLGIGFRVSPLNYTKTRQQHDSFLKDVLSGRIDDPGFLAGRYITMAGSDMAIIKYLDFIASDIGNNNWVLPKQLMSFKGINGTASYFKNLAKDLSNRADLGSKLSPERAKEMKKLAAQMDSAADKISPDLRNVDVRKYHKVPDTDRYGTMRGLYVHKDIWNDINGLGIAGNPMWGNLLKWSGRVQQTFKYTKVPMNIPTQVRNIISNTILMNVSGTNMLRIPGVLSKAMYDVSTNGKYMQLARKYGIETTTFSATELGRIDRELASVKSKADTFDGMWARARIFFNDYLDVGGRAYQKTEVLFKVAKMIDLMENHNKSEAEAAKLANEALLDYGNVSQAVRLIRTLPLGSPFVTFNAKAMVQMGRNIKNHPFASLKYAAIPYLMMEMFLSQNDDLDEDDWDSLMEFLPDYMETEFSTMVFPYKDDNGKWKAWDISFFLPWGAHLHLAKNVSKGELGKAVYENIGMFTGPAELPVALKLNEDPFTGQPIYDEADPPWQRFQDTMHFIASYAMPPMLMPRNRAGDTIKGGGPLWKTMMAFDMIEGNVGKDGLPRYSVGDSVWSWGGFSFQKVGRKDVANKLFFKQKDLDAINKRFLQMMQDPGLSQETRERLTQAYREYWMDVYLESSEWAEHLEDVEKLFK